jgi:hypothetical protein
LLCYFIKLISLLFSVAVSKAADILQSSNI